MLKSTVMPRIASGATGLFKFHYVHRKDRFCYIPLATRGTTVDDLNTAPYWRAVVGQRGSACPPNLCAVID